MRLAELNTNVHLMCFQKIPIHTSRRVIGKSNEGWGEGVFRGKIAKGKFEPKLEFPKGLGRGGSNQKNPPWEGYGYFLDPLNTSFTVLSPDRKNHASCG